MSNCPIVRETLEYVFDKFGIYVNKSFAELDKVEERIEQLEAENKRLVKFEDYSCYVGIEITCSRTPRKYSLWLEKGVK